MAVGGNRNGRSSRSSRNTTDQLNGRSGSAGGGRSGRSGSYGTRGESGRGAGTGAPRLVVRDSNRIVWIVILAAVLAIAIVGRLIYLDIIVQKEYSKNAAASHTTGLSVEPRRGTIYDRNGKILAISVDATTVYCNPAEVTDPTAEAAIIAKYLGGTYKDYVDALSSDSTTFAYVKRKVDVDKAEELEAEGLAGIYFLSDTRREYPYGEVGGNLIGATNVEVDTEANREYYTGISGLEYWYNETLSGTPGYYEAEVGRDGSPIPGGVHESTAAVDGTDIVVSIDIEFQQVVESSLKDRLERMGVESGTAVVMDGGTGEIYACASYPFFNPADRSEVKEGSMTVKAISSLLEPGSIFKTVSAMTLLEEGAMDTEDTLYCPATLVADGYEVSDAHERGDTTYSLRQIMQYSSNVGISLAVENMGFDKLYEHIVKYDLHSLTGIDFPGEQLGYLLNFDSWSRVTGYNVSFGQGISVTPLQLVRFYGALVNNGVECTPHFLIKYPETGETPTYETKQIIENTDAISKMNSMLQTVVEEGTGSQAAIEGYDVAGKTSTAEVYDEENGGYKEDVYNLGFCGFINNSDSKFVCYVGANEVIGDGVTTPMFNDIMTDAVERYHITSYSSSDSDN